MYPEMVRVFFQMLTQLDDVQAYESLILSAIDEVLAALKPDADPAAQPLHLLAAAIANCHYQTLQAVQDKLACTYAGTVPQQADRTKQISAAKQLQEQYRQFCSPWLLDTQFCFCRTKTAGEENTTDDCTDSTAAANAAETNFDTGLHSV
ncbi:MAG: hypothetical protein Q4D37_04855 [Oscillospiraceae bacterium]|nr:hypothetical protein [Oscillospiraceae bacterium]